MSDVTYRRYRDGDERAINDAFNTVFGLERPLAEWHWKFFDRPEGRWIVVAEQEAGGIVAHYGALPVRMRFGDLVVLGGQIVDAFSRREVRGRRVFTELYWEFVRLTCNADAIAIGFGFPGRRHFEMGMKVLEYVTMGEPPYWAAAPKRQPWSLHRYDVVPGFSELAADDLWRAAGARYPYSAIRNAAWLRRRYTGRPGVDYVHLSAWRGGQPRAAAVARVLGSRLRLAEVIWDGDDEGALAALESSLRHLAWRRGLEAAEMWLQNDPAAEAVFAERGWARQASPEDLLFVARSFHPGVDLEAIKARIYLTYGDSDLV